MKKLKAILVKKYSKKEGVRKTEMEYLKPSEFRLIYALINIYDSVEISIVTLEADRYKQIFG